MHNRLHIYDLKFAATNPGSQPATHQSQPWELTQEPEINPLPIVTSSESPQPPKIEGPGGQCAIYNGDMGISVVINFN